MTTITEQLGRVLSGRYRLDVGLGTGSSAHVYAAYDTRLNRQVAVKLLHPGLARDERFLRRLRAEAQAVAALNHPHVLEVFDWGEEEDGPFLVLEYLGGGSLQDMLDAGHRLDVAQAAAVGAELVRRVKERIGVTVDVQVVDPDTIERSTGKMPRVLDHR